MSDQEIPEWAFTRVVRLANPTWDSDTIRNHPITVAFARYIAQHEQPPVDPLEEAFAAAFADTNIGQIGGWAIPFARFKAELAKRSIEIAKEQSE